VPVVAGTQIDLLLEGVPLLLGLALLTKISPRTEWIGRPVVAFLAGTAAAVAVSGAMLGTIFLQTKGSIDQLGRPENLLQNIFVLVGTVVTLAYFQFSVTAKTEAAGKRGRLRQAITFLGQVLISMTLGVIFAGVYSAALTALVERIQFILFFFGQLLK
jgi:hypothetical protein